MKLKALIFAALVTATPASAEVKIALDTKPDLETSGSYNWAYAFGSALKKAGMDVRETIPDLVRAARKRHPHLPIETTSPLGEDQRIADIVVDRMDAQSERDRHKS